MCMQSMCVCFLMFSEFACMCNIWQKWSKPIFNTCRWWQVSRWSGFLLSFDADDSAGYLSLGLGPNGQQTYPRVYPGNGIGTIY